jgi:hypothetical protein
MLFVAFFSKAVFKQNIILQDPVIINPAVFRAFVHAIYQNYTADINTDNEIKVLI